MNYVLTFPPNQHYKKFILKPIEGDDNNLLLLIDEETRSHYDIEQNNYGAYFWSQRDINYEGGIGKYWSVENQGYLISKHKEGVHSIRWVLDAGAMLWHDNPPINLFEGFTICRYRKGYCLIPTPGHPEEGIKYYYHSWWQKCNKWWFFRTEPQRNFFINHGASFSMFGEVPMSVEERYGFPKQEVKNNRYDIALGNQAMNGNVNMMMNSLTIS